MAERADLADAFERLDGCGADVELDRLARGVPGRRAQGPAARCRCHGRGPSGLPGGRPGAAAGGRDGAGAGRGPRQRRAEASGPDCRPGRIGADDRVAGQLVAGRGWRATDATRVADRTRAVNLAFDEAFLKLGRARYDPRRRHPWVEAVRGRQACQCAVAAWRRGAPATSRAACGHAPGHRRARAHPGRGDRPKTAAWSNDSPRSITTWASTSIDEKADAEYAAAFRDYGVDVYASTPLLQAARLAASPVAVELANALDQWTFMPEALSSTTAPRASRLSAIAKIADPDPWRIRLRDTLEVMVTDRRGTLNLLKRLAATADMDQLPEASATRLAFALASLGSRRTAINLLRRTQRAHPDDFWINMDLGRELMIAGQHEEAGRFFSVAVAIRPRSSIAQQCLGSSLEKAGRIAEAVATLQQAIRSRPDDSHVRTKCWAACCWNRAASIEPLCRCARRPRSIPASRPLCSISAAR